MVAGRYIQYDRSRETTRRPATVESVFLSPLAGTDDESPRAVIRNDVYLEALRAAQKVLRGYYMDRRRQI